MSDPETGPAPGPVRLGIDVGGTFTDTVLHDERGISVAKVLSTHPDPTDGVLEGLRALLARTGTELADVTEVEYRQLRLEKVVLVGVWVSGTVTDAENSLRELAQLAETAGSQVLDGLLQRRQKPDPGTYLGSGKAAELAALVASVGADTVVVVARSTPLMSSMLFLMMMSIAR